MVIMTAKLSKSKLFTIGLIVLAGIVLLAVCLGGRENHDAPQSSESPSESSPTEIKTNDDRITFLSSFGWKVREEPTQTQEVRIPTDPSDVFERYNDLQLSQGFDLHAYAGKNVKRYVYEITNYPDNADTYYATLLIYKNEVIGADICSSAQGGTMHGLNMPK